MTALDRYTVTADGCWQWQGAINSRGYGCCQVDSKAWLIHRLAYTTYVGPIPVGLTIDHECHNRDLTCQGGDSCKHRRCFNPEHLRAVTHLDNQRASHNTSAGRTVCSRGHELAGANLHVQPRGSRVCIACRKIHQRAWREKQAAERAA